MKTGFLPLTESDRSAFVAHFLRLSREDRRLRFCVSMDDQSVRDWCTRVPLAGCKGYFRAGELVAVVMVAPDESPDCLEFAVSIDEDSRGTGLGSALLDMAIEESTASKLVIRHLAENAAMARVYRRYPFRKKLSYGELDVHIDTESLKQEHLQARGLMCASED